ncbi:MAG: ATP-binding protein [Rhodospirillaceae bacterium]
MAILSASILIAWLATAGFTYLDARREIDAMLSAGMPSAELQAALAESVAAHLMHPLLIAVPVLGLVIWLSVGWGLAPLRVLASQVRARDPEDNAPLAVPVPKEVKPLVTALDGLFERVVDLIERERRFTADAAHEMRTPLAGIRTHAQVALAARDDDERRAALSAVVVGTERVAHLVEQLLMLARLETMPVAGAVDVGGLAAQMVGEWSADAARAGIDLGVTETAAGAVMRGDAHLLSVLLRNLLENALHYVPAGGRIDVAVRRDAGTLELAVLDDGPGIPPDERPKAFDRFHRGLGTGIDGCGLGLSIVARIAELHGAGITLGEGLHGRGLGVRVRFPV